ncbi:MAG: helix-turn-helix transcriptional regulator [Myxococcota bacterium]|nr:helix-turn-helix transcriptional regulator [Myxococcota bacterium]
MSFQAVLDVENQLDLYEISYQMKTAGLPKPFIAAAVKTALEFEGVYDLMRLWQEYTEPEDRAEIIADLQDMIDDCEQKDKVEAVYIRFDDLDTIAQNIRQFKDSLREKVDARGGITKLAQETGIPQPSLSRFFNSASRPRRNTLYRIAKALKLSEVDIATEWKR